MYYHDMERLLPLYALTCLHASKNTRKLTRHAKRNHNKIKSPEHLFTFCSFYGKLFARERTERIYYAGEVPVGSRSQRSENEKEQCDVKRTRTKNSGLYESGDQDQRISADSQGNLHCFAYQIHLVRQGYLVKDPSKPRALMVVDPQEAFGHIPAGKAAAAPAQDAGAASVQTVPDVVEIPVVGRVAAGKPILADENIEDSFPVPSRYAAKGTNFMLRVRGESMIEAGIMDGDLILVQQTETANNGEIVVAMIDGFESEATVKTFYRENGHVRLQPENHTMSPIIVEDVRIMGKVKGVFRYFS